MKTNVYIVYALLTKMILAVHYNYLILFSNNTFNFFKNYTVIVVVVVVVVVVL
jgi:hypothetical protein